MYVYIYTYLYINHSHYTCSSSRDAIILYVDIVVWSVSCCSTPSARICLSALPSPSDLLPRIQSS